MYGNYNQPSISNIDSQIANLERMKATMQPQAPITNVINTNNSVELEAKVLKEGESMETTLISRRTVFIDEIKGIVAIKETNGDISKSYQIIVPKDPKDQKIEELEEIVKEMRGKIDGLSNATTTNEVGKSDGNGSKHVKK